MAEGNVYSLDRARQAAIAPLLKRIEAGLDSMAAADVRGIPGEQLAKLRNELVVAKAMLVALSPPGQALIKAEVARRGGAALSVEDVARTILPLLRGMRIRFALEL